MDGRSLINDGGLQPPIVEFLPSERFLFKCNDVIKNTKSSLDILAFQFSFPRTNVKHPLTVLIHSITELKKLNAEIRILLNGRFVNRFQHAGNIAASKLFQSLGINCIVSKSKKVIHAKMLISDGETAILGSSNFSMASLSANIETAMLLKNSNQTKTMTEFFNNLWKNEHE